jgi:prolipoprotein diacylglyceryltransferase
MEGFTHLLFIIKPVNLFGLTYVTTIIFSALIFALIGQKQKYAPSSWIAIMASVLVLFIIGLKLFAYSFSEWGHIFTGTYQDVRFIKYIPGGILLVAITLPLIKRFLKFNGAIFDDFIIFLPLVGSIQRIGCFFNGCCHGTVTDLPWAVSYTEPSALFYSQYDKGMLEYGQMHSLGVHPTQLYTIILSLLIFCLLLNTRKLFKVSGNRSLFALMLMGCMRFVLEFFREPKPDTWSAIHWQSLNVLQWAILFLTIIMSFIIYFRERHILPIPTETKTPFHHQYLRSTLVILSLIFLVWQIREIFDPVELIAIYPLLFCSLAILSVHLYNMYTSRGTRLLIGSLLVTAFFSMGQTLHEAAHDSTDTSNQGWFSIGPSFSVGAYDEITRDCSGDVLTRAKRNYSLWGMTANYHYMLRPDRHFQAGLRQYLINSPGNYAYEDYRTLYISPFISYDRRIVGGSLGLVYSRDLTKTNSNQEYRYPVNSFLPSIYVRLGNANKFYVDIDIYNRLYFTGLSSDIQLGGAFCLNQHTRNMIRAGFAFNKEESTGIFFGGEFLIGNQYTITPYITIINYPSFSINMQYHIGKNRWKPVLPAF